MDAIQIPQKSLLRRRKSFPSEKIDYLLSSLLRYGTEHSCPHCGSTAARALERKYLVTRLFCCPDCFLQFRHPKEAALASHHFYQNAYAQADGITTDLPDEARFRYLESTGFGEKNIDHYATLFESMFPGRSRKDIRILDYGCSWGYQSYQFRQLGFHVSGFEISELRAAYGRERLGLDIATRIDELASDVDIFFSNHVMEHVPDPGDMITQGMLCLRRGGFFVSECPNGSAERRCQAPRLTSKAWGRVHPNLISAEFLSRAFQDAPFLLASSPFNDISARFMDWDSISQQEGDLSGANLLIIAKKN